VRRKGRTIANVIGYLLAVAIMVVLVSSLVLSKEAAGAVLTKVGAGFIAFIPEMVEELPCMCGLDTRLRDKQNEGFVANGVPSFLFSAVAVDEAQKLPTVADASPCLLFNFHDQQWGSFTVAGIDPGGSAAVSKTCCAAKDIVQGQFFQPGDSGVVVLEKAFASSSRLSVGAPITIAGTNFKVAGIVNPGVRPAKADIYMPFDEAKQVIGKRMFLPPQYEANIVLVRTASASVQQQAMKDVASILGGRGLTSTYRCFDPATKTMGINEAGVWLISIIVGISVVALAFKSQYSSVIERRRDIGTLKAIGWSDGNVVSQILAESVIQATIGGVLGCLLAVIILLLVPLKALTGVETTVGMAISPLVLASGFGLALVGGIIAGIFPALSAARLHPADSLRRI